MDASDMNASPDPPLNLFPVGHHNSRDADGR